MNPIQPNVQPIKIDVKPLKIMLMTNLEESGEKKEQIGIPFTNQVLYNPELKSNGKMNVYPYFCISHLYPKERFAKYTYEERVRLFFEPNRLKQKMEEWNQKTPLVPIPSRIDNPKKWNNMVYQNIFMMLQILFPTSLPVKNNVYDTYLKLVPNKELDPDEKIESAGLFDMQQVKRNLAQLVGGPVPYSYLRLNGKIYTITRAYWLNDIFNHPIYKELAMEFEEFKKWKNETRERIEKEKIQVKQEELKRLKPLSTLFFESQSDKNKTRIDELKGSIVGPQSSVAQQQRIIDLEDQNEMLQSIIQKIRDINTYIRGSSDVNIVNTVNDLNNQVSTLKSRYSVVIPEKNNNEIRILSQIAKTIEQYQVLQIMYFGNIINIDIDNKENTAVQLLRSEFSKYVTFVDMLKKFVYPDRQSTNNDLYRVISEYLQKKNQHLEFVMDEIFSYSGKSWRTIDEIIKNRIQVTNEEKNKHSEKSNANKLSTLLQKFENIYNQIIEEATDVGLGTTIINSSICRYQSQTGWNDKLCSGASTVDFERIKQNIVLNPILGKELGVNDLIGIIDSFNRQLKSLGGVSRLTAEKQRIYKKFLADVQNLLLQVKEFDEFLLSTKPSTINDETVKIESILKTNLDVISDKSANFEMYLDVSLIGGELNSSNYGKIKCLYKGEHLNEMYKQLKFPKTYKTWLLPKEPFYDLDTQLKKIPEKKTKGGKTRRNANKYLNKTRKMKK
jgi:hypothetical protein